MNKRKLFKELSKIYPITKAKGSYDFDITLNNKTFHILVLPVAKNAQVTLNSQKVWEVASGRLDGIRFKKTFTSLHNIDQLLSKENRIVYLTKKPYRILKHLNESDIIDVTNTIKPNGEYIINNIEDFEKIK